MSDVSDILFVMSESRFKPGHSGLERSIDALSTYITKNKTIGEQNREKILYCLINTHPEGKSTSELTNDTGLDRDTIHEHCTTLLEQGLVIKKHGKRGKYYLTSKSSHDPGLRAYWFNHRAMQNFWSMNAHKNNSFCKLNYANHNDDNLDQESLFVFANNIGAYITYVLLEAVRPDKKTLLKLKTSEGSKKFVLNNSNDETARKWIEKSINPLSILNEFEKLQCVKRGLRRLTYTSNPVNPSFSYHVMNEENFKKLTKAFATTFPHVFEKLETIRKQLRNEIHEENRQFSKWKNKLIWNEEMQKRCDSSHLVKSGREVIKCDGIMNVVSVDKLGNKHKKCSKCGKIIVTEY
jgi:predicted transcriptional regulator